MIMIFSLTFFTIHICLAFRFCFCFLSSNSNSDIGGSFAQKYDKHDSEIDADMWLKCRLMLCGYLHQEDNAVGRLSGPTLSLVGRVGCLEDLLESALVECKMFNDSVTACLLQFLQIQVDLKCGRSVLQILDRLEVYILWS